MAENTLKRVDTMSLVLVILMVGISIVQEIVVKTLFEQK